MASRLRWLIRDIAKQLWFTVALYSLLGVGTALSALLLDALIPPTVSSQIGADAVDRILGILTASMLAVATFSISTMVQAFASAATGATPRATQLVVEDRTAQRALATFIGSFVFSLVGLIALSTGAYGPNGRLLLFAVTIGVVALIVIMLLRWIDRLSRLGRVGETVNQVEQVTCGALQNRRDAPCLGGQMAQPVPSGAEPVVSRKIGYLRRIDVERLSQIAEAAAYNIHITAVAGAFLTPDRPCAFVEGQSAAKLRADISECFHVDDQRSFEDDPRFGLIVLSEIASRALSPAVNDPGTAIDVIGTMVRLLSVWGGERDAAPLDMRHPRLFVPALTAAELVQDGFAPIARDGAAMVEVHIRLQKAMMALDRIGDPDLSKAVRDQARDALARAEKALVFEGDVARLRDAATWLDRSPVSRPMGRDA